VPRFFGLTPSDKEIFLQQIFNLMYYMGFSYKDAYNLPIWQRIWFIERTNKELKAANDQGSDASRAAHANSPEHRALQGRARENVPANLRRFT
jgi:hypothetical protein